MPQLVRLPGGLVRVPDGVSREEIIRVARERGLDKPRDSVAQEQADPSQGRSFTGAPVQQDRSEFSKGISAGVDSLQGSLYGLAALMGDSLGQEELTKWGMEGYARNEREGAQAGLKVGTLDEIHDFGDFLDYAGGALGQAVPSLASMAAGGGVGGLAGKVLAKQAVKNMVKQGVKKELAELAVENALKDGAKRELMMSVIKHAPVGGAFVASAGQQQGQLYVDLKKAGIEDAVAPAWLFGAAQGALDIVGEVSLAKKILPGQVKKELDKSLLRGLAKGTLKQGAMEGATEGAQSAIGSMARILNGEDESWTKEDTKELLNNAAAGALVGVVTGLPGSMAERMANSKRKGDETKKEPAKEPAKTFAQEPKPEPMIRRMTPEEAAASANLPEEKVDVAGELSQATGIPRNKFASANDAPAAAPAPVADNPSAEPALDINAQMRDLADTNNPRRAVYLSADNLKQHPQAIHQTGMDYIPNVDGKGGALVLRRKDKIEFVNRVGKGEAIESVIGSMTLSGEGKKPNADTVVQQKDADGAVTAESLVPRNEAQAVAQKFLQPGRTVEATTPEAALQRRLDELQNEQEPADAEELSLDDMGIEGSAQQAAFASQLATMMPRDAVGRHALHWAISNNKLGDIALARDTHNLKPYQLAAMVIERAHDLRGTDESKYTRRQYLAQKEVDRLNREQYAADTSEDEATSGIDVVSADAFEHGALHMMEEKPFRKIGKGDIIEGVKMPGEPRTVAKPFDNYDEANAVAQKRQATDSDASYKAERIGGKWYVNVYRAPSTETIYNKNAGGAATVEQLVRYYIARAAKRWNNLPKDLKINRKPGDYAYGFKGVVLDENNQPVMKEYKGEMVQKTINLASSEIVELGLAIDPELRGEGLEGLRDAFRLGLSHLMSREQDRIVPLDWRTGKPTFKSKLVLREHLEGKQSIVDVTLGDAMHEGNVAARRRTLAAKKAADQEKNNPTPLQLGETPDPNDSDYDSEEIGARQVMGDTPAFDQAGMDRVGDVDVRNIADNEQAQMLRNSPNTKPGRGVETGTALKRGDSPIGTYGAGLSTDTAPQGGAMREASPAAPKNEPPQQNFPFVDNREEFDTNGERGVRVSPILEKAAEPDAQYQGQLVTPTGDQRVNAARANANPDQRQNAIAEANAAEVERAPVREAMQERRNEYNGALGRILGKEPVRVVMRDTRLGRALTGMAKAMRSILKLRSDLIISDNAEVFIKMLRDLGLDSHADHAATKIADMKGYAFILQNTGNQRFIFINPKLPAIRAVKALAHEIGHVFYQQYWSDASVEQRRAVNEAFDKFITANPKFYEGKTYDARRQEWIADNVAAWLEGNKEPRNAVESFFKDLADLMKAAWEFIKQHYHLDSTVNQFINETIGTVDSEIDPAFDSLGAANDMSMDDEGLIEQAQQPRTKQLLTKVRAIKAKYPKLGGMLDFIHDTGLALHNGLTSSLAARIRRLNNESFNTILSMFYHGVGEAGGFTYDQAVANRLNNFRMEYDAIMETVKNKSAFLEAMRAELPVDQMAKEHQQAGEEMRKLIRRLYEYQVAAGLPIKEVDFYFPQIGDIIELTKPDAVETIWQAIQNSGVKWNTDHGPIAITREMVEQWVGHLSDENYAINFDPEKIENLDEKLKRPALDSIKARVLQPQVREVIRSIKDQNGQSRFYAKDMDSIMMRYIRQVTRRAEYNRRFGEDVRSIPPSATDSKQLSRKWNPNAAFHKLMDQSKAPDDQKALMYDAMAAFLGQYNRITSEPLRRLSKSVMFYQNLRTLLLVTLSSFPEIATLFLRSGNFGNTWRVIRESAADAWKKGGDTSKLLRSYGFAVDELDALAFKEFWDARDFGTNRLNEQWFRMTGLTRWTNFMRGLSLRVSEDYVRGHARRVLDNLDQSGDSLRRLEELGISAADVKIWKDAGEPVFAQTGVSFEDLDANRTKLTREQIEATQRMTGAITRMINEMTINPTAAMKPLWRSDERFAFVSQLGSFTYGFQEVVLKRVWYELNRTGAPTMARAAPLIALMMMVPLAALGLELKELLQYTMWGKTPRTDGMDGPMYMRTLIARTGVLGVAQLGMDAYDSAAFGRDPIGVLLGPTVSQVNSAFRNIGQAKDTSHAVAKEFLGAIPGTSSLPGLRDQLLPAPTP